MAGKLSPGKGAFLCLKNMFTGIITNLGTFVKRDKDKFMFLIPKNLSLKITKGASISIDGVCLTVAKKVRNHIYVDVTEETLAKTTLENLKTGLLVNLELPVTAQTLFSGHLVQGHIDAIAQLAGIKDGENSRVLKFSISPSLSKYIVAKGSIAVSGIALTVIEAGKDYFTAGIIPYTWDTTILHTLKLGDFVNIETDILAKYVERLLQQ